MHLDKEWDRPLNGSAPKTKKTNQNHESRTKPVTVVSTYNVPLPCPVCGTVPRVLQVRGLTVVACDQALCAFRMYASGVWDWNESIKQLTKKKEEDAPPPIVPKLVVELGLAPNGLILRLRVVEQNLRGFAFNNTCRIKGVEHLLYSDQFPEIREASINVRGSDTARDNAVSVRHFATKAQAESLYDEVALAVEAYNDYAPSCVLPFPGLKTGDTIITPASVVKVTSRETETDKTVIVEADAKSIVKTEKESKADEKNKEPAQATP